MIDVDSRRFSALSRQETGTPHVASAESTLKALGWRPPTEPLEAMFAIQSLVGEGIKRHPERKCARRNIGEFVTSYPWWNLQLKAIFGDEFESSDYGATDQTSAKINQHIAKALKDMSSYGQGKGGEPVRKQILNQFNLDGAPLYADEELAVVGGGVENALKLTKYTLEKSVPPEAEQGLRTLDWRKFSEEKLDNWLNGLTGDRYSNLIIENSAKLSEQVRAKLQKLLKENKHFVVTDVIIHNFDGSQPHLALDEQVGDHVIMVDGTPLARASGLSAVFADAALIKPMQTYHTRTLGPPPTTQSNLRLLLSGPEMRQLLKECGSDEAAGGMPGRYSDILSQLAMAIDSPEGQGEEYYHRARELVRQTLMSLEGKLNGRYNEMFAGAEGTVVMGGGRQGNVESLIYLRSKGVKKALITGPGWTYKDMRHLMDELDSQGIHDMEIIFEPNGTKIDGQIDVDLMKKRMEELHQKDEKFVLFANSGPNNPTGRVPAVADQKELYDAAVKYGATDIIDDCAYIECADPKDRNTYAQIHKDRPAGSRVPILINMATLSKGITSMPSGRLAYVSSDDAGLREFLTARRDKPEDGLNSLSIMLADAILSKPDVTAQLDTFLREDIKKRVDPTMAFFKAKDVKYLKSDHYYICAEAFEEGEDGARMSELLAKHYRAGAIAINLLSGMEKVDQDLQTYQWKNWVRFALGGHLPTKDGQVDYDLPAREVAYWFDSLRDLREKIKKARGIDYVEALLEAEDST